MNFTDIKSGDPLKYTGVLRSWDRNTKKNYSDVVVVGLNTTHHLVEVKFSEPRDARTAEVPCYTLESV